ncbi:MAG: hypothetical protein WAN43_20780 [Rhodomicrobium sp.]|jgi:hypothetical protein
MKIKIAAMIVAMAASALCGAAGANNALGSQEDRRLAQPVRCNSLGAAADPRGPQNISPKPAGVRLALGRCSMPGQRTCINGWLWICQCFSYGCEYMATSSRCY